MRALPLIAATFLVLLAAPACDWPRGDGETPSEVADTFSTGADSGVVASDTLAGADTVQAVALGSPSGGDAPLVEETTPPALAAQESSSVEDRLDLLIAAQVQTQARLDSLASLVSSTTEAVDSVARGMQTGEVLGEARNQVRNFGVGVLWSIVVVFLFNYLVRLVAWVLDQLSERSAKRRLFFKGLVPIVRIVLWLFAGYLIVRVIFQVDAQGIIAGAAALGVAVGFAAQDLLKNLFGGIILVFDQPFQVGDKIRVGETYGEVTSIGLRSTRIVTPDDNLVSVPNAQVVDQQVANANAGELNCQVVIDLYLPGDVDEAHARRIAFEAAVGSRYVYLNKPIVVLIRDELHRSVFTRVRVKAYVLDPRHEFLFESDVTERARAGFRAAGMMGGERRPPTWTPPSDAATPTPDAVTTGDASVERD
jgi:small-conductance mechanosensitive channel